MKTPPAGWHLLLSLILGVLLFSGCCAVGPGACGNMPLAAGVCGGPDCSGCAQCGSGPAGGTFLDLLLPRTPGLGGCGYGCGPMYWNEWLSDPPDCNDPCGSRYGGAFGLLGGWNCSSGCGDSCGGACGGACDGGCGGCSTNCCQRAGRLLYAGFSGLADCGFGLGWFSPFFSAGGNGCYGCGVACPSGMGGFPGGYCDSCAANSVIPPTASYVANTAAGTHASPMVASDSVSGPPVATALADNSADPEVPPTLAPGVLSAEDFAVRGAGSMGEHPVGAGYAPGHRQMTGRVARATAQGIGPTLRSPFGRPPHRVTTRNLMR